MGTRPGDSSPPGNMIFPGTGAVILIGSTSAGDTIRIQRFLVRNGYPHRLIDTDREETADDLLGY